MYQKCKKAFGEQKHNDMCPSPHLPQMQQDLWQWRHASFSQAHIQHIQLSLSRWPCFLFAGTDHGGVKRSIGEIVDTDEPSIPRKKKYAKEAWPGAAKFCQIKKTINWSTIFFIAVFQGESRGRRKDCFEKGSQVQFCIEMLNLQNCFAKIAFEMSIKDELLLKYRHVNLRSLQLGPSTMLKVHLTDIISPPDESM